MTHDELIEVSQTDREAAASVAVLVEMRELILAGRADHHAEPFARHRITAMIAGAKMMQDAAAKWAEDDAKLCDCFARDESECACGAWCEWKQVPMSQVVDAIRQLDPAEVVKGAGK